MLLYPGADVCTGIFRIYLCFLKMPQDRGFGRRKHFYLLFQFFVFLFEMCGENQACSQTVAVVEHFFIMGSAKAYFVCLCTDIVFHVGSAGTKDKIHGMLFQISFNKTERTFVLCAKCVHERDSINFFFHSVKLLQKIL